MFGLYAAGIASALGMSFLIKFFMLRDYAPAPFMLELPDYKMPRPRSIAIGVYTRAMMFLQRAGTTIFSMMVLIWFLASFPQPPAGATDPAINYSLAAMIGKALEPLLAPVGFNWQIAVALIPGMAAREVAVAALGTVYAIEGGKEAAEQIGQVLANEMESRDRAVAARLVHLRAAMRLDAGGDPARDRKLDVDVRSPSATCSRWPMRQALRLTASPSRLAPAEFSKSRCGRWTLVPLRGNRQVCKKDRSG